ncbi:MAG TPA: hypothetical protein VIW24_00390 [Aldersonia sp.]
MSKPVALTSVAKEIVLSLSRADRDELAECLREELDPPVNATFEFEIGDKRYTATALSNGWTAITRPELPAERPAGVRSRRLLLFDLLRPGAAVNTAAVTLRGLPDRGR